MKKCDLIVVGKYVLTINERQEVLADGAVAVLEDKIIAVGGEKKILAGYKAEQKIGGQNVLVMPGLVNTHSHAAMSYFRGLVDDLALDEWLKKYIWPMEAKYVNANFVRNSVELAGLEMIKSGITCFNDMYFFADVAAKTAEHAGIRACIGEVIIDFSTPSCETADVALAKTRALIKKYKESKLINISVSPHSIYTCNNETLIKAGKLAKEYKKPVHIHVSETKQELKACLKERGLTPAEYLEESGILNNKTIAAHSIWLNEKDHEIFKRKNVGVSHNPVSNMKLASGVAPICDLLDLGINVGLGTDSAASNNTLDLLQDMRICSLLHKVSKLDPVAIKAKEVVKMATINGAKVLGLDREIGSLEVGKKADIITIDLGKPHLTPFYDPFSLLVYCVNGTDVNDVIIGGKALMLNREVLTLNEKNILNKANKFKAKLKT